MFLNNKFIEQDKARIATSDRGLLLADGFFTTLLANQNQLFYFDQHWQRLIDTAHFFAIPITINKNECRHVIQQLIINNKLDLAAIRITITRGEGGRGIQLPSTSSPTLLITANPYKKNNSPIKLMLSEFIRSATSPLSRFKTLSYLENIMARKAAINNGFDDAVLLNEFGRVVCTTTANIFLQIDNTLFTPALSEGALPGIQRAAFIEQSTLVKETQITPDLLNQAQTIFLTNSLIGQQKAHYTNA